MCVHVCVRPLYGAMLYIYVSVIGVCAGCLVVQILALSKVISRVWGKGVYALICSRVKGCMLAGSRSIVR